MPLSNYQPSLALTQFVPLAGVFPNHSGSDNGALLGFVRTFAGNFTPGNSVLANDTLLQISQNTALFSLYGTTYGGDGRTTFAVPGLTGRTVTHPGQGPGLSLHVLGEKYGFTDLDIGQEELRPSSGGISAPIDNDEPSQSLSYVIQIYGNYPTSGSGSGYGLDNIGNIYQTGANFTPDGYMFCEGQLLPISEYEVLFSLIGTTYGGDGQTTFALPDLRGRTIVGTGSSYAGNYILGEVFGSETTILNQANMPTNMGGSGVPFNNVQPSLALNYLIALQGYFPSNGSGTPDADTPYLGEIIVSATNVVPGGFALCAGQLLPISQNQALFALLGTTYGGDGRTTFALPDLRGRDVIGAGGDHPLGEIIGSAYPTLTSADIAPLTCVGDADPNTFYGGDGDDNLQGAGSSDTLVGNSGNDRLNGGSGDDTMTGGAGNDTYTVSGNGDVVTEQFNQGMDLVISYLSSYTLGANVENLTLQGTGNSSGSGNELANRVNGNSGDNHLYGFAGVDVLRGLDGNDVLDGGADSDILMGGAGNDTYIVDDAGTVINEAPGGIDDGGTDTVEASITFTLGNHVENLILTGNAAINGIGNALDNVITGNDEVNIIKGMDGADRLNGKGGADRMLGGSGNDVYYVDNVGDICNEQSTPGVDDGGADQVISTVSYAIGNFIETLILAGTANINGTGNGQANNIKGNSGDNALRGRGGNDNLTGGNGADTFIFEHFGAANGIDHLKDFVSGTDRLSFRAADYGFAAGHHLTVSEFSATGVPAGASAQFVYDPATHELWWDANGAAAGGRTAVCFFDNGATPVVSDFVFT